VDMDGAALRVLLIDCLAVRVLLMIDGAAAKVMLH
jgi:hypothetical protein